MTWPPDEPGRGAPGQRPAAGRPGGRSGRPPERGGGGVPPSSREGGPGWDRDAGQGRPRRPANPPSPDPRYRGSRQGDPRYGDPGYNDPRYGDPRRSDRYGDQRYSDPRSGDPRYGDPRYGQPSPPPEPHPGDRPFHSPARRAATTVAAVLSLLLLAVTTIGWASLRYYDGKVTHIPLTFAEGVDRPEAAGGGAKNILLVGSDTRDGTGGEFGQVEGQRADTTILAHLGEDGSTTLVSFPRDLWVEIPAYVDDSGTAHDPQEAKLNAAFAFGGPSLLVQTIEGVTGIRVDNYVEVNFLGFQAMTDALGGVTVCVKELPQSLKDQGLDNLNDDFSGFHGQVGDNRLDGGQALAFVRQRHGLPEGDIDRIRRQQQFLGAMFREATSTSTLANPFEVTSLLDAATSALTVDDATSLADLQQLAVAMRGVGSGGVRFETVPTTPQTIQGQAALVADPAELAGFLAEVTGQSAQGAAATVSLPAPVSDSESMADRTSALQPTSGLQPAAASQLAAVSGVRLAAGTGGELLAQPASAGAAAAPAVLRLAQQEGGSEPAPAPTSCTY